MWYPSRPVAAMATHCFPDRGAGLRHSPTAAETAKNGSENSIRTASSVSGSGAESMYASFTNTALVEKQSAPATEIRMPVRYRGEGVKVSDEK